MDIERILCPVDFSPASEATAEYTSLLARRVGARLGLMHAAYIHPAGVYAEALDLDRAYGVMRDEAQKRLSALQERLAADGTAVESLLEEGPVVDALRESASKWQADLVVLATHGRQGLRRWLMGSTAELLLRTLPMPLLTLTQPAAQQERGRLEHVVAAVDFPLDEQGAVIEAALGFASRHGARLTLVHVLHGVSVGVRAHYLEVLVDALERRLLARVPADLRELESVNVVVEAGVADQHLLAWAARPDVDLLVVGGRAKGPVERTLVGATVERLVREAQCPVLTVPAREHRGDSL